MPAFPENKANCPLKQKLRYNKVCKIESYETFFVKLYLFDENRQKRFNWNAKNNTEHTAFDIFSLTLPMQCKLCQQDKTKQFMQT